MKIKCLSIAGFDGSGGAGIQADLKTFSALGCYGMTVLTALPVQNTCGVRKCYALPKAAIAEQLHAIFDDVTPDAIKIGMLFSADIVFAVSNFLTPYKGKIPIVLDPVMTTKSGDLLLQEQAIKLLKEKLIPLVTLISPNLPEAHVLVGKGNSPEALAKALLALGSEAVLLKGGHNESEESNDLLLTRSGIQEWLKAPRIPSQNTHGTGCTLAAAVCAYLARGYTLLESCQRAKRYLFEAMNASKDFSVGKGRGPVHHFYHLWPLLEERQ